jgi:hypothetical protein
MSRPMSYLMAAAIASGAPLVLLAEIEHPSGTARFWSGIGQLTWDGETWSGIGELGTITPIQHTSAIAIQEIEFTLSGADPAIVATLDDDVRNLSGRAWLAALDQSGKIIEDPIQIVDSTLDFQSHKINDDGTATISITARSGFYSLERALDDVWSAEDQRKIYPDDSGLDMISKLQNQELQWGP